MNPDQAREPLSRRDEARLLLWVRFREAGAHLRKLLETARLRTALVVVLSVIFWFALFALFYLGFRFVTNEVAGPGEQLHARTVEFIFHLFFASLNVMLVFSSGVVLYNGLFASRETRYLLTVPLSTERVVLHKFQEAVFFSGWGFFLLASPLTIAYGLSVGAPWHYYLLIGPLIGAFVYIPCLIGAFLCLLLIYRFAHVRLAVLVVCATAASIAGGLALWDTVGMERGQIFDDTFFNSTVSKFEFTRHEWLPSSWLSDGLIDAAQPRPKIATPLRETPVVRSLMCLALLTSNALFGRLLLGLFASACFRKAFSQLECRPRRPRQGRVALIDRIAQALLSPLPTPVGLLLLKDWRLLRRDPSQWSQFLIFFGLLGLYLLNVDRFSATAQNLEHATWVNFVSFLNLAVVGLILSTFTTRFIYPMLSLEGRRFWVLGLMPVSRRTIVWSKFAFSAIGSWGPCAALILLSDLTLQVTTLVIFIHQLTTVLLCLGLAAMAVGLGATMPNFRESSPSKISAGFGGTLNLVLSAIYIIVIVVLTALPCHFKLIADSTTLTDGTSWRQYIDLWLVLGAGAAVAIGLAATIVPLQKGVQAFERLEFS